MNVKSKELCPNCINLIEVIEERKIIREEEIFLVERVIQYCQSCQQELVNTINLKFKYRMG